MAYCQTCGESMPESENYCTKCGTPTSTSTSTSTGGLPRYRGSDAASSELAIAGFWTRVLGYVVDSILLFVVIAVPLKGVHLSIGADALVTALANILYWTLTIAFANGRSLGMAIVGVRCVRTDGGLVDPRQAARRAVAYTVLLFIGSLYQVKVYTHPTALERHQEGLHAVLFILLAVPHLVDLLWAAWDPKRQTIHDKVAGTICVLSRRAR